MVSNMAVVGGLQMQAWFRHSSLICPSGNQDQQDNHRLDIGHSVQGGLYYVVHERKVSASTPFNFHGIMIMLIHIRLYFRFMILLWVLALNATTKVKASDFFQVLILPELRLLILRSFSVKDLFSLMEALNVGIYQSISIVIKNDLCNRVNAFDLNYIDPLLWRECEDQNHGWRNYRAFTNWFCEYDRSELNNHIRGVPMYGMVEYKPLVRVSKENIKFVISYVWIGPYVENIWHVFGEMMDGSVFYFNSKCCYTGFSAWGDGLVILAPTWDSLLQNMSESEIEIFILYLNLDDFSKEILAYSRSKKYSDCTEIFSYFLQTLMLKDEYESYKAQVKFENQELDSKNLPSYIN